MMRVSPRFVVDSSEDLETRARSADPPVELGERAQLTMAKRVVMLECTQITPLVEWVEVVS
jgi:hypothetical protein